MTSCPVVLRWIDTYRPLSPGLQITVSGSVPMKLEQTELFVVWGRKALSIGVLPTRTSILVSAAGIRG